ncbi:PREDICTED: mitochondrial inner membrane protease subunit 2-like [Ipomoea nil]|uniref:mitochondrial inner membrane protease subunit 2-like n=1 Tax=Ipomoea nil TaxID=35883 RepID=UPI000900F002|nr:PREDICTED: mitochondrial inner membrane protease subunit 2-like [Ipomoea nil]XP_019161227.1 PREDICTED: mitochondrial inner membrane protease subunit 2-like [Ipomoea nil]
MGTQNILWNTTKNFFTGSLIAITISDRYANVVSLKGVSMAPTFNPHGDGLLTRDRVLMEKLCLGKYEFSQGDVVVFRSPSNHQEKHLKRITALPGDWIGTPHSYDAVIIPEGHCWVEGDNAASSFDSRSYGPIPLGLICGRVTHIIWPPQRIGTVERSPPQNIPPL